VGIWVARYLGPANFGLLNYSIAFVGLFTFFRALAPPGIVLRELVRRPDSEGSILGTAVALTAAGRLMLLTTALVVIWLVRPGEPLLWGLVGVAGTASLVQTAEMFELWFRARVSAKHVVLVSGLALTVAALFRLLFVHLQYGIIAFACAYLLEAALSAIGVILVYRKRGGRFRWLHSDTGLAVGILREGWPLIISATCAAVYLRIDQVMLGQMMGDTAVGLYSVVVRISSLWYIVPQAVINSVYPAAIRSRDRSEQQFARRLQVLFTTLAAVAYAVAIPVAFSSSAIVRLLYGGAYAAAAPVLAIHIFASLFVFIGLARGIWVTTESRFIFSLVSNLAAALVNVVLNWVLIPIAGVAGAAYATLISYFVAYVATAAFLPTMRPVFIMQLRALLLLDLPGILAEFIVLFWRKRSARET